MARAFTLLAIVCVNAGEIFTPFTAPSLLTSSILMLTSPMLSLTKP